MIDLVKELVERNWDFDYQNGILHIIYRNSERYIENDDEAKKFLEEIRYE